MERRSVGDNSVHILVEREAGTENVHQGILCLLKGVEVGRSY